MTLPDLCIRRPVLATVMSLLIVLVGLVSYTRLTIREYPNIDPPVVTVTTDYTGASAPIVETQVTNILEEAVAGIEGIDFMTSISRSERSQITINFALDVSPEAAANDVRDRVGRVRGRLPDEVEEPRVQKVEADAQPIIYLAFSSTRHSALEINDFADRYVKDQLQTLRGVAEVRIFGERRYSMRLWLDPARLAAYGLTPQDVEDALRRQNVEVPSGRIESQMREFTVLSETDLRTVRQFEDMVISNTAGRLVRFTDLGRAELAPQDTRRIVRFRGNPSVSLGVVKTATANPLDVSQAVRDVLPRIRAGLPDGMGVDVGYDRSVFIERSIENVYMTIAEAVLLVVVIIFLFLRSLRATLMPLVTIPVSLIGACALMAVAGFSINSLTLLAMVLAIGLVVDDAIVMLENIHRHVEEGKSPYEAARVGAKEIAFPVLAMTLTLAAVYAPIGFLTGSTGKLFTEFAWTLAGTVLVSGFVALSLTPMMCSRLLKPHESHGALYRFGERVLNGMTNGYRRLLGVALRARLAVVLIGLAVAGTGGYVFTLTPSELAPVEDQGTIVMFGVAPEGSTIDYTDTYARRVEKIASEIPEIDRYFTVVGFPLVSNMIAFVRVNPWEERERKTAEIIDEIRPKLFAIPGILAFPSSPPPLGQSVRAKPVEFVIQSSRPYAELQEMADAMMERIAQNPNLLNVESDLKLNQPELRVDVDRDKAGDLGISMLTVGRTLETLLGGRQVTRFKREGEQYDVIIQMADVDRRNPDDLAKIYLRAGDGRMIHLSNLVSVRETVAPKELNHFNQLRAVTISASLAPGYALGDALTFLDAAAAEVLPATATTDYAGQSREFREASSSLALMFVLALAFIYLVLSAQFESFRDPFIIMLTVPLSMAGALVALNLFGGTLNIYSQVGLVTLIGLITKHGILIVEFSNQMRDRGLAMREAVIEASVLRLRPILMTTGAMVLGAVPLAIATGAGAESRQQIGIVIVGGILVGTLFTIFVIPAVYTLFAGRRQPGPEAAAPEAEPKAMPAE